MPDPAEMVKVLGPRPWAKRGNQVADAKGRLVAEARDAWMAQALVEAVNAYEAPTRPEDYSPPPKRKKKASSRRSP